MINAGKHAAMRYNINRYPALCNGTFYIWISQVFNDILLSIEENVQEYTRQGSVYNWKCWTTLQ